MSEPPSFSSSPRKQSLANSPTRTKESVKSTKKKESVKPTKKKEPSTPINPPTFVPDKSKFEDSMKQLDIEDITETELTEDMSGSIDPYQLQATPSPRKIGSSSSVHTAPPALGRASYSKPIAIDKDARYANFDSGFGERRESRMCRVQRIKSNERVLPSLESQQRAIAQNRRRGSVKDGDDDGTDKRAQQELESVRSTTRMSIKERMAMFNGSSSELSSPI
jgi:hypothetical protein